MFKALVSCNSSYQGMLGSARTKVMGRDRMPLLLTAPLVRGAGTGTTSVGTHLDASWSSCPIGFDTNLREFSQKDDRFARPGWGVVNLLREFTRAGALVALSAGMTGLARDSRCRTTYRGSKDAVREDEARPPTYLTIQNATVHCRPTQVAAPPLRVASIPTRWRNSPECRSVHARARA
jgi:hypothetical protein